MSDVGRGVAFKSSSSSRTLNLSNRRSRVTDSHYVAESPANSVEVDQIELNKIRHEALTSLNNNRFYDTAKKVYNYINRANINEENSRLIEEEKENENKINEEKSLESLEQQQQQKTKFFKILFSSVNRSALFTLLIMTLLMIIIPIGTFYFCYLFLFLSYEEKWRLTNSGLFSVLTVNILTIGFGLYAYYEPEEPETEEEKNARISADEARVDNWVKEITRGRMVGRNKMANQEIEENKEE